VLEARFYETYYFCNIIRNVLCCPDDYLRILNDFYGDGAIFYRVSGFQKYSVLHDFIEFVVEDIYYDRVNSDAIADSKNLIDKFKDLPYLLDHIQPTKTPIERALDYHDIEHVSFQDFLSEHGKCFSDHDVDDVYEYFHELREQGIYRQLIEQTSKEVFHVLFQNRELMKIFNEMMAGALEYEASSEPPEGLKQLFSSPGILKRAAIPAWAKRAVFFRDRGRCVLCDKDLSGQVNLANHENYDHIVPLARHGLNDVSNIQLLCKQCNQIEKKAGKAITSRSYQSWYSY